MAVSEEIGLEADMGEFVVESASAAALATNVSEGGPSSVDEGKLELANNVDFLDNSQLTGTGASWTDDRNSIPLEGEEDGEVIQGMVLEEEEPAPAATSSRPTAGAWPSPSPLPRRSPCPPARLRPPPRRRRPRAWCLRSAARCRCRRGWPCPSPPPRPPPPRPWRAPALRLLR